MNFKGETKAISIKEEALEAETRIRPYIRETPVECSRYLSLQADCDVFLKLENLQSTGSFKLRGALNKFLSLSAEQKEKGIVTASSGNHGVAVAYLLDKFHAKGTIFVPEYVSPAKLAALRLYDVDLKLFGDDCVKTEALARETAVKNGLEYISPYNDPKTVGGQATVGIELSKQLEKIDAVLVAVGGGSLIAGIAGYLKSVQRKVEIIGCQPENSAVMYESIKAGKILDLESKPTISDGSAGGIEPGSITFDMCKDLIDDFVLLTEDEIKAAIKLCLEKHNMLVEGAGALSVAAFLKSKERFKHKNVVLIISGAKISLAKLREIVCDQNS